MYDTLGKAAIRFAVTYLRRRFRRQLRIGAGVAVAAGAVVVVDIADPDDAVTTPDCVSAAGAVRPTWRSTTPFATIGRCVSPVGTADAGAVVCAASCDDPTAAHASGTLMT